MEYTEDQFTEWFDFEKVKPTNRGVYQVLYEYDDNTPTYSLFENGFFNFLCHEAKYAELYADGNPTRHIISFWRGLKSNLQSPQNPAKKKGNKRKTMHVVFESNYDKTTKVCVGCYTTKKNAEIKAESVPYGFVQTVRFRTPEA